MYIIDTKKPSGDNRLKGGLSLNKKLKKIAIGLKPIAIFF